MRSTSSGSGRERRERREGTRSLPPRARRQPVPTLRRGTPSLGSSLPQPHLSLFRNQTLLSGGGGSASGGGSSLKECWRKRTLWQVARAFTLRLCVRSGVEERWS
eukprot:1389349-Rhodomonas_salina.1